MEKVIEIAMQTILAFFAVLIYARLLGKQQMSQLTFYDYIAGITIGSIAGSLATDVDNPMTTLYHFIALTLFSLLTFASGILSLKSRPIRKILEGEPAIVIHNGKILEQNMKKMWYNLDDLLMQLREKNVFNLSDVEFAVAEPNGELSILLKTTKQPLTPGDMQLPTQYQGLSSELIMDGRIIEQNLRQNNLTKDWLYDKLRQQGITDIADVVLAVLDTSGNLYVDKKADGLKGKRPEISDITN